MQLWKEAVSRKSQRFKQTNLSAEAFRRSSCLICYCMTKSPLLRAHIIIPNYNENPPVYAHIPNCCNLAAHVRRGLIIAISDNYEEMNILKTITSAGGKQGAWWLPQEGQSDQGRPSTNTTTLKYELLPLTEVINRDNPIYPNMWQYIHTSTSMHWVTHGCLKHPLDQEDQSDQRRPLTDTYLTQ